MPPKIRYTQPNDKPQFGSPPPGPASVSTPDLNDGDDIETRVDALTQAVQHHGLSMRAPCAIPPAAETIIATAKKFEDYLHTGVVPEKPAHHGQHNR